MGLWRCFLYLATIGILAHFVGLILSHCHFPVDRAPWRSAPWECEGRFWNRTLHVRGWMDAVPDMSRIMPDMVPKRIDGVADAPSVERLIRETCVAELIHWLLALMGFACVSIWNGIGGWTVSLLYGVGNMPFVVIQRYNRPRLIRLHRWLVAREAREEEATTTVEVTEV